MKSLILTFALALTSFVSAQDNCEQVAKDCNKHLTGGLTNSKFVSDGQVYTAFLDNEKAEFKTTFFGNSVYRIAASAGSDDSYVIFTVKDMENNILYTNKGYKNSPYWDFKITSTIPVIIEAELDSDKKVTGCAVLMIGFKR